MGEVVTKPVLEVAVVEELESFGGVELKIYQLLYPLQQVLVVMEVLVVLVLVLG